MSNTRSPWALFRSQCVAVLRAAAASVWLAAALFALTLIGMCGAGVYLGVSDRAHYDVCQAACSAECLGVERYSADYCTCDTRAVVPGCEVSR
jgi:hypothetical protein